MPGNTVVKVSEGNGEKYQEVWGTFQEYKTRSNIIFISERVNVYINVFD